MKKIFLSIICIPFICISCSKSQDNNRANATQVNHSDSSRYVLIKVSTEDLIKEQEEQMKEVNSIRLELEIHSLIYNINHNDINEVLKKVTYPFRRPYPLKNIQNEYEFLELYDNIVNSLINVDSIHITQKDEYKESWNGTYFKNGMIWICNESTNDEYKWIGINNPNLNKTVELDSLHQVEREIIGLNKNDSIEPQICYLSNDSSILICLVGANLMDKNTFINIYRRQTAFIPQVQMKVDDIQGDCYFNNLLYSASQNGFAIYLKSYDGYSVSKYDYVLSISKKSCKRQRCFIDSLYREYKHFGDCKVYLTPTYLHEVAQWW